MRRVIGGARPWAVVIGCVALGRIALAQAAPQSPAGFPAEGAPPTVTLMSAGAEPRRPLRYAIAADRTDHMSLEMTTAVSLSLAGATMPALALPTMHLGADVKVTQLSPAGEATYKAAFTEMKLINPGTVDPAIMTLLQSAQFDLTQASFGATVSPRGFMRDVSIDTSKLNNPQMAQMLAPMSGAIQQLAFPFPEEAVGVGAHWQLRQAVVSGPTRTFQKIDVELVTLDAASCTLKVTTVTTAPPQTVAVPGLPAGVEATIESLAGSGSGTMAVRFDSLIPTSSGTATTDTVMNVTMGGQPQRMSAHASIQVKVSPGK